MRGIKAILLGGVVAGALDIIYAIIIYGPLSFGLSPMRVLQSVAAGWIGREATRAGEWNTALLGLGTHFMLATIIAAIFVTAANAVGALARRPVLWGFLYGLVVYVMMNYVVVPLSAAATGSFATSLADAAARLQESFSEVRGGGGVNYPWMLAGTILTHTLLVGVPIALINARFNRQQA